MGHVLLGIKLRIVCSLRPRRKHDERDCAVPVQPPARLQTLHQLHLAQVRLLRRIPLRELREARCMDIIVTVSGHYCEHDSAIELLFWIKDC